MELEYINCNLCNSNNTQPVFKSKDYALGKLDMEFSVVQCCDCGLTYVNPRPTEKELPNLYVQRFFDHNFDLKKIALVNRFKYVLLKKRAPGVILDVGCKKGEFLAFMKNKGWDVFGVEISKKPEDYYDLGTIARSKLEESDFKPRSFDVITAWAVIEHMYDPFSFLKKAHEVLKDDGELIFLVTNMKTLPARILKNDDIPRHLYLFSKDSIKKILDKAGFSIEKYCFNDKIFTFSHKGLLTWCIMKVFGRNADDFFMDRYNLEISEKKNNENLYQKIKRLGLFGGILKSIDYSIGWVLDKIAISMHNYGIIIVKAVKKK